MTNRVESIRAAVAALNRGDVEAYFEHFDAGAVRGDDRSVCARWRMRGTQVGPFMGVPSTGATIDVQTCEIYEFQGDLVVVSYLYGDHGEMFRQMAVRGES
jgi:predicted ester cyclase